MAVFEALEQLWNNSDVETEESLDISEISEEEEEEDFFLMDPVHDQEQAGPFETQESSLPPLCLSLYLLLLGTMVQKKKMSISHLPIIYVVPQDL
ncbi:hypothetical protein CHARACLAT_003800 [Characodon lateralis]|uniref:Uncharacterized protein n=1 Tax=Characodon lateralis TaxID=208331 RepID=A0ABU7D4J9_9TELE|nr:hypothetical protein [Characodon lateralis]